MKKFLTFILLAFSSSLTEAQTMASFESLTRRVEELERQQNEFYLQTSESATKVNSFLRSNLTFGGFFEPAFTVIHGEDTKLQASNSSNILGINLAADFNPNTKFVSQFLTGLSFPIQNQHNDPRAVTLNQPSSREFGTPSFGAIISQGYISYIFDNHYTIAGGLGYVPFGYYAQQREMVLFVRRGGPQILRTTNLFSPLFNGFNFNARYENDKSVLGYEIYSFTRLEDSKRPGLGVRASFMKNNESFKAGLSYQTAKFESQMENIMGADIRLVIDSFIFTSEYARHFTERGDDPWSYYFEPSFFISEDVIFYTFYDYANHASNKTGSGRTAISDPMVKSEYGGGFNWLPSSYTRLRLGLTYNDYIKGTGVIAGQDRDYITLDLSAGVAF